MFRKGAPEALEQAAVAVGIHRQLIDHRVIGLGAYGDGAVVIGEVLVIDGGEPPTRIAAVPAVVHAGVDELDILLLQRPCDGGGQTGALVQILQMPGIGDHGGGAAVPTSAKRLLVVSLPVTESTRRLSLSTSTFRVRSEPGVSWRKRRCWEKRLPSVRSSSTMVTV